MSKFYVYYQDSVGQSIFKKFSTVAQGLEYCHANNLVPILRKIPNASLIVNVEASQEKVLKKLEIEFLKQKYIAAPTQSNIEFGKTKSVKVPLFKENLALSNLPLSMLFCRYYDPDFALESIYQLAMKEADVSESIDHEYLNKCRSIIDNLQFDSSILEAIIEESLSEITTFDDEHLKGLSFDIEDVDSVLRIRSLLPANYTAFIYESYFPKLLRHPDQVPPGIIYIRKAIVCQLIEDNKYIEFRGTSAPNYELDNACIQSKISKWKERYNLVVLGASDDSLDVQFDTSRINDLDALSKEIIEFCPEIITQASEDVGFERTKSSLTSDGLINFWWD